MRLHTHGIDIGVLEGLGDLGEYVFVGVEVVRMQEADHVAGGAGDALVQGVLDAAVGLADQGGELVVLGLQDLHGAVGAGPVDGDVLAVGVALRGHEGKAAGDGVGAVEGGGDDGAVHGVGVCDVSVFPGGTRVARG
jgi:hypothetical protein